ncbi:MAG: PEP-CTERM sorting domain-containing protein [Luteolibacter sp.]
MPALVGALAIHVILSGFASTAQAATIIEGFSTEVANNTLSNATIDGQWHDRSVNSWSMTSGSGGVLTHSPIGATYNADDEGFIGRIVDLSGFAGNSLTLSFGYDVGAGNTIYAHLRAVDSATTGWNSNIGAQNGNSWDSNSGGTTYNLFDGLTLTDSGAPDPNRGSANEAVSFTGSGNYSETIDLSGYAISDLGNYKWLLLGFAANATTDNTSTISNLSLTVVPEPSTALLGGLGMLALLRWRRHG